MRSTRAYSAPVRRLVGILGALTLGAGLVPLTPAAVALAEPAAQVVNLGDAAALGAPEGPLDAPLAGIASHPRRPGYWLLGYDGGIFTYGAAAFYGSTGGMQLNAPVVGMAASPSGRGYWLVARDGGVFSFGDARFYGSTGNIALFQPIVGIAPTPSGRGYWLVARDGGVFSFGDAHFYGSTGGMAIGTEIVGMVATPTGRGYAFAGSNGRIFSFGNARYIDAAPLWLPAGIVDVEITRSGRGYWQLASDGAVYSYGDAAFHGGANSGPAPMAAAGLARTALGAGYWIASNPAGPPVPAGSGSGRRIVYSNSGQRVWLVEENGYASHSWLVSGRRGAPSPGTYRVFSKSPASSSGSLRLPWMSRFVVASSGKAIGFHGIPLRTDGTPIQTDAELGQFRSHGCVRMNQQAVKVLYDWAPIGTPVVVLP